MHQGATEGWFKGGKVTIELTNLEARNSLFGGCFTILKGRLDFRPFLRLEKDSCKNEGNVRDGKSPGAERWEVVNIQLWCTSTEGPTNMVNYGSVQRMNYSALYQTATFVPQHHFTQSNWHKPTIQWQWYINYIKCRYIYLWMNVNHVIIILIIWQSGRQVLQEMTKIESNAPNGTTAFWAMCPSNLAKCVLLKRWLHVLSTHQSSDDLINNWSIAW